MEQEPVKILIVDDRDENHLSLKSVLEDKEYEFVDAHSGKEALRILLNDTDFTLIIMDVVMPGMDGIETASYIAQRDKLRDIPIIFLTAKDVGNQIFRAFDIGAVDYISKPVIPELLRAKVNVFVELSTKNRMLELHSEMLKATNEELKSEVKTRQASERKIKKLNTEISKKLQELEALDAFSYSIAHDFRSPLNNISMVAHLIKSDQSNNLNGVMLDHVKRIDRQVKRLNNLIDDLLMFSHQDIMIKKEELEMLPVVNEVVEELRLAYKVSSSCKIKIDNSLPVVNCNPGLIKQVWSNLISNAIKYSQEQKNPVIEIGHIPNHTHLVFFVRDNGIGFKKSESKELFKIFNRLDSAKDFEGSGVGLALVKRIVEKHGGQIWAESVPNKKTTFSFHL